LGFGVGVRCSGIGVEGSGFMIMVFRVKGLGLGFRVEGIGWGFRVQGADPDGV